MTANNKLLVLSLMLSFFILIWAPRSKASEHLLATISTDINDNSYELIIDDNEFQALQFFYVDNFSSGHLRSRASFPINAFITEGIKFDNKGPFRMVEINSDNFDKEQGGIINISALYNILTGKKKNYEMQIAKDKVGWALFYQGQLIKQIIAYANRLPLVGVVGAKELIMK